MTYIDQLVGNVVACWERSSETHRALGREWYGRAGEIAAVIHPSRKVGAAVIAALSPNVTWEENVKGAAAICRDALCGSGVAPTVAGYGGNRDKAWRIAKGEWEHDPIECLNDATVGRNFKVNRFYANICGDLDVVTVDRWAARVAQPMRPDSRGGVRGKEYLEIELAYQLAANVVGVKAAVLQATCWIAIRGSAE